MRNGQLTLGNNNNFFLIIKHHFTLFSFCVTNVFCVSSLFCFCLFFFIPLLFLNNRSHSLFIFIFCYLPSYPNLVNLFLIYIRNHFHFYSNQIIPFLFYFLFFIFILSFLFFYITNLYQFLYIVFFFSHVSLYFLFSFL